MGQLERKPGGPDNWIEALPKSLRSRFEGSWIYRAAIHMARPRGEMSVGHAIAVAVNAAKKGCATGDLNWNGPQQVNPKSRAEMCAAVATWNAMKAASKADTTAGHALRQVDLAVGYVGYRDGDQDWIPAGGTAAYLEIAEA